MGTGEVYRNGVGTGMSEKQVGRPANVRRLAVMQKYGMKLCTPRRLLTESLLDQLDRCQSEEARKLLLGVTENVQ